MGASGTPVTRGVLSTSVGTHRGAFTALDWALFISIGLIWGSSFLFIAIGLDAFEPGLITWLRVLFGAGVLWLVPAARHAGSPEDRARLVALSFLWVAVPSTLFPLAQQWISSGLTGLLNGSLPDLRHDDRSRCCGASPGGRRRPGSPSASAASRRSPLPPRRRPNEALGVALVLLAVACYGIAMNIAAPSPNGTDLPGDGAHARPGRLLDGAARTRGGRRSSFAWGPSTAIATLGALGTASRSW